MDSLRFVPPDFFADVQADGRIETAMLLQRHGRVLAAWASAPVSWDVLSIMAATALGSLETMLETLRAPSPQALSVVASGHRVFIVKVEPQAFLLLIARESVPEAQVRDAARRLLAKIPQPPAAAPRQVTLGPSLHEPRGVEFRRNGNGNGRLKNP